MQMPMMAKDVFIGGLMARPAVAVKTGSTASAEQQEDFDVKGRSHTSIRFY